MSAVQPVSHGGTRGRWSPNSIPLQEHLSSDCKIKNPLKVYRIFFKSCDLNCSLCRETYLQHRQGHVTELHPEMSFFHSRAPRAAAAVGYVWCHCNWAWRVSWRHPNPAAPSQPNTPAAGNCRRSPQHRWELLCSNTIILHWSCTQRQSCHRLTADGALKMISSKLQSNLSLKKGSEEDICFASTLTIRCILFMIRLWVSLPFVVRMTGLFVVLIKALTAARKPTSSLNMTSTCRSRRLQMNQNQT